MNIGRRDTNWTTRAACLGLDPELFFLEHGGHQSEVDAALTVCANCPVRIECLEYALQIGEEHGIFGGVTADRRRHLTRAWKRSENDYQSALGAEISELGRRVSGHEDDRPHLPEMVCGRCDKKIKPGRHPIDRNGPNARCGNASTYNKGCRCDLCSWGKTLSNLRKAG